MNAQRLKFQFPSNGKAYPKNQVAHAEDNWHRVSIPFKRESLSKVKRSKHLPPQSHKSFNSLQTGKPIQRNGTLYIVGLDIAFQFPSNGKAYPKQVQQCPKPSPILFQFPSNGKAYPKETSSSGKMVSILEFQFPSNGKAYPKPTLHA